MVKYYALVKARQTFSADEFDYHPETHYDSSVLGNYNWIGRNVSIRHLRALTVGKIVNQFTMEDGSFMMILEIDANNYAGQLAVDLIKSKHFKDVSLDIDQLDYENTKSFKMLFGYDPQDISLVEKGQRRGAFQKGDKVGVNEITPIVYCGTKEEFGREYPRLNIFPNPSISTRKFHLCNHTLISVELQWHQHQRLIHLQSKER